jgi:hypothetical protein
VGRNAVPRQRLTEEFDVVDVVFHKQDV